MKTSLRPLILAISIGALALSAAAGAVPHDGDHGMPPFAVPFAKLHDQLKLTPQQEALWAKADAAAKTAREEGRKRHEEMHARRAELKKSLAAGDADLHALAKRHDDEMVAAQQRMRDLRDQWLAVYDSLDAGQKRQVQTFMAERLDRKGGPERGHGQRGSRRPGDGAPAAPAAPATSAPAAR